MQKPATCGVEKWGHSYGSVKYIIILFPPPGSRLYSSTVLAHQNCYPILSEVGAWPNRSMSFSELRINGNWNGFG